MLHRVAIDSNVLRGRNLAYREIKVVVILLDGVQGARCHLRTVGRVRQLPLLDVDPVNPSAGRFPGTRVA